MRVAINLLSEDPNQPTGAQQFWIHLIEEMDGLLRPDEQLYLVVSPANRHLYQDYGPNVHYITFPWSNERRWPRTLSEHLWTPLRFPLSRIDVFNTGTAPIINPTWQLVLHMKTMHAYTEPEALSPPTRLYRRANYPRSARAADAIVINSESLRDEINRYLEVDQSKMHLVYEAVNHDLFKPPVDREAARESLRPKGVRGPYVLFLSSLWRYKNCGGLLRAWASLDPRTRRGRQVVVVGFPRDQEYADELVQLAEELGIAEDVLFVGGVDHDDTAAFYQAADLFAYPSMNETFGLTILEAMASGCPVLTSNCTAMPEIAGGAAELVDPNDIEDIARGLRVGLKAARRRELAALGLTRAAEFSWKSTAEQTLDVYRHVYARK